MLDLAQRDIRAYARGRVEEPFPSVHVSFTRAEEQSSEWNLDAIIVLALLVVNSGLIMAVSNSSLARFEGVPGTHESLLAILWLLQAVITFLFFVVVARWLRS